MAGDHALDVDESPFAAYHLKAVLNGTQHDEASKSDPEEVLPQLASIPEATESSCKVSWRQELIKQLVLAPPIVAANVFVYALGLIALVFVGHYTDLDTLAAVTLGNSFYLIIAYIVLDGLPAALYVDAAQAFGAGRHGELGLHLQRAVLVNLAATVPMIAFFLASPAAFATMSADPKVNAYAGEYMRICCIAAVAQAVFSALNRWLNVQCIAGPGMAVTGVTAGLSLLFHWLFIVRLSWGVVGAALAWSLCAVSNAVLLLGYVLWDEARRRGTPTQRWHGLQAGALRGWGRYLRFAAPSLITNMVAQAPDQVLTTMAVALPNASMETDIMAVASQVISVAQVVALAVAIAMTVRVGNHLGALSAAGIRAAVGVGAALMAVVAAVTTVIVLAARSGLATALVDDLDLQAAAAEALIIAGAMVPGMCGGMVCIGVAQGLGYMFTSSVFTAVAFGAGLGVGAGLAYNAHMGAYGLLLGLLVAYAAQAALLAVWLATRRFKAEVEAVGLEQLAAPPLPPLPSVKPTAGTPVPSVPAEWVRHASMAASLQAALSMATVHGSFVGAGGPRLAPVLVAPREASVAEGLERRRSLLLGRVAAQHCRPLGPTTSLP